MIDPLKTDTYYLGCAMQQSPTAMFVLESVLNEHKPEIIIEIGTARGGLTAYLGSWALLNNAQLHTYDIADAVSPEIDMFLGKISVNRHLMDVFDSEIASVINSGKVFLYCDGGDKTKELVCFNKHIKIGDIIGCHDYTTEVSPWQIDKYMNEQGFDKIVNDDFLKLKTLQMFWERRNGKKDGKKDTVCSAD